MSLNESIIRRSDLRRIYTYYGLSALSRNVYFEFIMKKWDELLKRYLFKIEIIFIFLSKRIQFLFRLLRKSYLKIFSYKLVQFQFTFHFQLIFKSPDLVKENLTLATSRNS
jgi:hypothetical protein